MKDFFISYNKADRVMAVAIKAWIEDAGFTAIAQATDFHPGSNFVLEMDRALKEAKRTIAVLSPSYLDAPFPQPEWAGAFAKDPTGKERGLVPVRVRECRPEGLLGQVVYLDLVGLSMEEQEKRLLEFLQNKPNSSAPAPAPARQAAKKRAPKRTSAASSLVMNATAETAYQAGRDLIFTQKHTTKAAPVVPQAHHITDGQAKTILDLLKELGERDEKAGKKPTYGLWQAKFKERPWAGPDAEGITSYKLLAAEEYESAVSWIKQQKAKGRPALRRTQNQEWRNDHYGRIWGCAKKLGWNDDQVHAFAQEYLGERKPVESLKDLGEQKLAKVAGAIYRRARKASL
ncbi:MAG TPA: toll/interleukin-1 receptor domain-containing protein [Verrucomicrobiales bacterium]|nr:toll/interleukin-1 receptor domain-containing protein [Verrucomicrobiales bacterium]